MLIELLRDKENEDFMISKSILYLKFQFPSFYFRNIITLIEIYFNNAIKILNIINNKSAFINNLIEEKY